MPIVIDGNMGYIAPSWTTASRPVSPFIGEFGFNKTTMKFEIYNGTSWTDMG